MTPISGNKLKRNFLIYLVSITVIAGIAGAWIFHQYLPDSYFQAYPFIPIYFLLFGILYMNMMVSAHRKSSQKYTMTYVSARMMKLIISVLLVIIYGVVVKDKEKEFVLTFISFYLLYLIFETWFFFSCQRKR